MNAQVTVGLTGCLEQDEASKVMQAVRLSLSWPPSLPFAFFYRRPRTYALSTPPAPPPAPSAGGGGGTAAQPHHSTYDEGKGRRKEDELACVRSESSTPWIAGPGVGGEWESNGRDVGAEWSPCG